jgi:hypothetical protein
MGQSDVPYMSESCWRINSRFVTVCRVLCDLMSGVTYTLQSDEEINSFVILKVCSVYTKLCISKGLCYVFICAECANVTIGSK